MDRWLGRTDGAALSPARRRAVLAACFLSLLVISIDQSGVTVALPALRAELGATTAELQWVVGGYTLVLTSLLIVAGALADRVGRARTLGGGMLLYAAGSVACGLAPSAEWLIGCRVLQAVGGSMMNPVAVSILRQVFVDPHERAAAIGTWATAAGLGLALGPLAAGALVSGLGWPAVFWWTVPVTLAAAATTFAVVPESRAEHRPPVDLGGLALLVTTLALFVYAVIAAPRQGWLGTTTVALLVVALAAGFAFVRRQRRHPEPLVPPSLFADRTFSVAIAAAVLAFGAVAGFLFLSTLQLQEARGFSTLAAGLLLAPFAIVTAIVSPYAGRVDGARGPRRPLAVGGGALALAAALLALLPGDVGIGWLVLAHMLFGVGLGAVNAPITTASVRGVAPERSGVAAAVSSTGRQLGQTCGVAVIGAVAVGAGTVVGDPTSLRAGWWLVAGCGIAIVALARVLRPVRPRRPPLGRDRPLRRADAAYPSLR